MQTQPEKGRKNGRREFLKQTSLGAVGAVLATSAMNVPHVHAAQQSDTINIAIVGCGGRGMGALGQALNADANLKLRAMADVFPDKTRSQARNIARSFTEQDKGHLIDVPEERAFGGFDAYKQAMDALSPGDVVLLTTPPAFRPLHFAYAVEKGLNVFAEKPVAVDIPGLLSLRASNEIAKAKGLKVGVGLNNRHNLRTAETVKAIQDGGLGEVFSLLVYRCQPGIHALGARGNRTHLQRQLQRIFNYNWLTGGFIVDALIHNLDICCWANQKIPVSALGIGGRLLRRDEDDLIDNASVQYMFDDGKLMHMYTCGIENTWAGFRAIIHGARGSAYLGEGVGDPRFYRNWKGQEPFWRPQAGDNNSYQREHDVLFKAIRDNANWNEMDYGINATFTAILGRMATETGQEVTAEDAWKSTWQYAPNIDKLTLDGDSPVMPNEDGSYRIARPGRATLNNPYQM